jgi:preprotein translocase subunit SecA
VSVVNDAGTALGFRFAESMPLRPASRATLLRRGQQSTTAMRPLKGLDACGEWAVAQTQRLRPRARAALRMADAVLERESTERARTDDALRQSLEELRRRFARGRVSHAASIQALASVREAARRTLGMEPYRVQVAAAIAMQRGAIAELATGEGKTLSAGLLAVILGWRGRGCHVITVNDYLAARDADFIRPLAAFCGLSVAAIAEDDPPDRRRDAYFADITYATHKSVAADLLRDRLPHRQALPVLRPLHAALIDEADSIMIDEAVTPLIIAGQTHNDDQHDACITAARLAEGIPPHGYTIDASHRELRLNPTGRATLDTLRQGLPGLWAGPRRAEELVAQALTAKHLYLRDKQYVVADGKVVIVDESTGRLMPDRTWQHGLHQAVEAKEGLELSPPNATLAKISFQRFFRLYPRLCGMTGTAAEASTEFWRTYRTPVVRIPRHRPLRRTDHADAVYPDASARLAAMAELIADAHRRGRPVLVGTRSVQSSQAVSDTLTQHAIPHRVLNAVHHAQEADIVADAGQRHAVTIATNMAGRGTDIKLGPGVADLGGLLVIAAERNELKRVDRQLHGRAGRQGDPGEARTLSSLDDECFTRYATALAWALRRLAPTRPVRLTTPIAWGARRALDFAQYRAQRRSAVQRRRLLLHEDEQDQRLGFTRRY